ncbi:MAG: nucleoside deaminase [Candidatus Paceibacterota bacterium]|jgi:guanine deaminase
MNKFLKQAVQEGLKGVKSGEGGPFGAVIVKNNKVVAKAHNMVLKTKDPTAHAEINAIRKASKRLKTFDLSSCDLYSVSEPCSMCMSAIRWAKIRKTYFGCKRKDARKLGFRDESIDKAIDKTRGKNIDRKECLELFKVWENKGDKVMY